MRESITGDDLYAEILLLRGIPDRRALLYLEGPSDCSALDPHVADDSAQTRPGYSKTALLRLLEIIDQEEEVGPVLVVLDRDWATILEDPSTSHNVAYTEYNDMDATVLFADGVVERLIENLGHRDLRADHLERAQKSATEAIEGLAGTIGVGRYVAARGRWEVRFADFPIHEVADADAASVAIEKLAEIAIRRSTQPTVTAEELQHAIDTELGQVSDLRVLCNGHDAMTALATLARKCWGGRETVSTVEKMARSAFGCAELRSTTLFTAVTDWAKTHNTAVWSCAAP